jgi:hypothetical protein
MAPPPDGAVASILEQNIEYYGEFVDIVEQPDVGALAVPESIVEILNEAISVMLNYCMIITPRQFASSMRGQSMTSSD